jgi:hypothetical protein
MSQPDSDQQVTVTAEERAHPALRKLARAAILLAHQQLSDKQPTAAEPNTAEPTTQSTPEEASEQEVTHD